MFYVAIVPVEPNCVCTSNSEEAGKFKLSLWKKNPIDRLCFLVNIISLFLLNFTLLRKDYALDPEVP